MEMCLKGVSAIERSSEHGESGKRVYVHTRDQVPREFYRSYDDGVKHKFTRGCPGRSRWFKKKARQPHSDACREIFREILKGEAK
eukprot:10027883-Karenia_brevis.AAC.1